MPRHWARSTLRPASSAGPAEERLSLRLDRVTLGANLAGALLTFVYFTVLDPLPAGDTPWRGVAGVGVLIFVGMLLLTFGLGIAYANRRFGPLLAYYRERIATGRTDSVPAVLQRRALNYVPEVALLSLSMWGLAGTVQATLAVLFGTSAAGALRLMVGVVGIGGVFTSALVYVASELVWRRAIPAFFPEGRLSATPAWRRPVLLRLLVVFALVGIWPPALLVYLSVQRALALLDAPNPETIAANLVLVELFLFAVGGLASLAMALFVTRGITEPLRQLQQAMARVEQNDLQVQVAVTTNDELGFLSERFNQMVAGLREREHIRNMFGQYVRHCPTIT